MAEQRRLHAAAHYLNENDADEVSVKTSEEQNDNEEASDDAADSVKTGSAHDEDANTSNDEESMHDQNEQQLGEKDDSEDATEGDDAESDEPSKKRKLQESLPNDPKFYQQWGLHNTEYPGQDTSGPEAWALYASEVNHNPEPIIVAVVDSGVNHAHPDLASRMWVNPGEIPGDGIDNDGNGWVDDVHGIDLVNEDGDPMDDDSHGTHCAGIVAANHDNGVGVSGMAGAANVEIMAIKFLDAEGSGFVSDV